MINSSHPTSSPSPAVAQPTAPHSPALVDLTLPADLRELHERVLAPSFPPEELIEADELLTACAAGELRAVGLRRDGQIVAGAVASAASPGGVVLLVYLAIAPGGRGGGIGGQLLDEAVRRWVEADSPAFLLAEVEHPAHHAASAAHGDPSARLRFYARHGARALAVPYFQPAIGPHNPRVPALLLMTLHVDEAAVLTPAPGPGLPTLVSAPPIRAFLVAHLMSSEGELREDHDTRALLDSVDGETVALWDVRDLDQVPVGMARASSPSSSTEAGSA